MGIFYWNMSEQMKRTGISEPDDWSDVEALVADYALDAAESGIPPKDVAYALRQAADEVEYQDNVDNIDTQE